MTHRFMRGTVRIWFRRLVLSAGVVLLGPLAVWQVPAVAQSASDFAPIEGIDAVSAGYLHTCLLIDSEAWCTGLNTQRQLGSDEVFSSPTPLRADGLPSGLHAIAAGAWHSCAIDADMQVWCWGANTAGQLGQGGIAPHAAPAAIGGLTAAQVSAGANHTCAITPDGDARCWGENAAGQLGNGDLVQQALPVDVVELAADVTSIAAGWDHTCAVLADGSLRCWGAGDRGQLGHGVFESSVTPVAASDIDDAIQVVSGDGFSCVLRTGGGVACWGVGNDGTTGGSTEDNIATPVAVLALDQPAIAISASNEHTCALMQDATVRCWGSSWDDQLGTTYSQERPPLPVAVTGLHNESVTNAQVVSVGGGHSCALVDGRAVCWGSTTEGQRGYGRSMRRRDPVEPVGLGSGLLAVDTSDGDACAIRASGNVYCWGYVAWGMSTTPALYGYAPWPLRVPGIDSARSISMGGNHACIVDTGGGVQCWGMNFDGVLGDGTREDRRTPMHVHGLSQGVQAVSARGRLNCALRGNGTVACWGTGALGDGTVARSLVPVDVLGLQGVRKIGTGADFACALRETGDVFCWGDNADGQLGDGSLETRAVPVAVQGLGSGVVDLGVNLYHACALTAANAVVCWGYNGYGQLGDGTTQSRSTSVEVQGLVGEIASLHLGALDSCAIDNTGSMQCWGDNFGANLGDGTRLERLTAVPAAAVREPLAERSGGSWFSCGMTVSGAARCWGENRRGQLGNDGRAPVSTGDFSWMSRYLGPQAIFKDAFE